MTLFKYGTVVGSTVSVIQTNVRNGFRWIQFQIHGALVNLTAFDKRINAFAGFFLEYPAEMEF